MKERKHRRLALLLGGLCAACMLCAAYVTDVYPADAVAVAAFEPARTDMPYARREVRPGVIAFEPEHVRAGLIFYPGGKVAYDAYEPLMEACAARGILCVLMRMPLNLAVLDMNAADEALALFPQVESWYAGGHSLGGAMAAAYAQKHPAELDGLVLLGAYSTADLSDAPLRVLSVYGSEDGVMNREKYAACRSSLPQDTEEIILDGGCHAYFGLYGEQDGDGRAAITPQEQIDRTAAAVADFVR